MIHPATAIATELPPSAGAITTPETQPLPLFFWTARQPHQADVQTESLVRALQGGVVSTQESRRGPLFAEAEMQVSFFVNCDCIWKTKYEKQESMTTARWVRNLRVSAVLTAERAASLASREDAGLSPTVYE